MLTVKSVALLARTMFVKASKIFRALGRWFLRNSRNALVVFWVNFFVQVLNFQVEIPLRGWASVWDSLFAGGISMRFLVFFHGIFFIAAWLISCTINFLSNIFFHHKFAINTGVKTFWFLLFSQWFITIEVSYRMFVRTPDSAAIVTLSGVLCSVIFWIWIEKTRYRFLINSRRESSRDVKCL